ncbi:MAG TPA: hypothetical protein VFQ96_04510 [Microbacteriaceae bacterium]|nr:hypothetical protein [Microbacteriaceae bacterium]
MFTALTAGVQILADSSTPGDDNAQYYAHSPGAWAFFTLLGIGIVVVLLCADMVRRMRRVRYRAEIAAKLDAEEAELLARPHTAEGGDGRGPSGRVSPAGPATP